MKSHLDLQKWMQWPSRSLSRLIARQRQRYSAFKQASDFEKTIGSMKRVHDACLSMDVADQRSHTRYFFHPVEDNSPVNGLWCRELGRLVVDPRAFSTEEAPQIENIIVPDDQGLLGFTVADGVDGETQMGILVKHDGCHLPNRISNITSWAWCDNNTIVYATADDCLRPHRVMAHRVDTQEELLLLEERDERFLLNVNRTKDGRFITITSASKNATECWIMDSALNPVCIRPRMNGVDYFVEHLDGYIYLITNLDGAVNYKLVRIPVTEIGSSVFEDVYIPPPGVVIKNADFLQSFIALHINENGYDRVISLDTFAFQIREVFSGPDKLVSIHPGPNKVSGSDTFRFSTESIIQPETVYEYNFSEGRLAELLRHHHAESLLSSFVARRIHCTAASSDVQIPITLFHKKQLQLNHSSPVIAYVYGAYGECLESEFNLKHIAALQAGFVIALCHVRGGGELGKNWHQSARLSSKLTTFSDYIECIEHLIEMGISQPSLICASGRSAGGLAVAAVMNDRPNLFSSAIMDYPFVDVVTPLLNSSLPLSIQDRDEFGDPNNPKMGNFMLSYSPYQNIKLQSYPDVMITTSLHDRRVPYWIPLKYFERFRRHQNRVDALMLINICDDRGHLGHSDLSIEAVDEAVKLSFIKSSMKIP